VGKYQYSVTEVQVTGCLHLKSAVTSVGRNTLLANRGWFDASRMSGYQWIDVDEQEPHAANVLAFDNSVILPASFPLTRARLEARGFEVTPLDISELQKAESGLTCSSLLFDAP
jgi:dimethylargininase